MSRPNKRKEAPLAMPDDDWEPSAAVHDSVGDDPLVDPDDKGSRKRGSSNAEFTRDFDQMLFQLLLFKADTGNYHATKEEQPGLHSFLYFIKKEFKNYQSDPATSNLTADQVKVLEHLHVPLTSRGDDHWARFYDLLVKYQATHGHVLVPRLCEVPGLGDWVTDQRRQVRCDRRRSLSMFFFQKHSHSAVSTRHCKSSKRELFE